VGARLGQHFLFDPSILGRIADAAGLGPDDTVLEIGPGKGTLTAHLAARAGRVVAIEADGRLAAELREGELALRPAVEIVHADALRVPWPAATCVCGNIPYRITSPLIERGLARPRPRCIVFLMQREVADRLAAPPGSKTYGALSAGVQLVATVERLFGVPRGAFRPPPRVDSAVVRIVPLDPPPLSPDEEAATRGLIRQVFQRRRQQLRRTLSEFFGVSRPTAEAMLGDAGIAADARPEVLAPSQFVRLAAALRERPEASSLAEEGRRA
jgi:16S rRNA (adenine1518-N6/adenine1519-N6)-dimethyltransferase